MKLFVIAFRKDLMVQFKRTLNKSNISKERQLFNYTSFVVIRRKNCHLSLQIRFQLLGGIKGLLEIATKVDKVSPDIKTFSQMLNCIEVVCEALIS
jgi:hypothetical protein